MSPRPDVSEERKKQIIEAGLRVFSRRGLQQATMDDIVAESGLSKGTLYWYFESKDDIIIAILENLFTNELSNIDLSSYSEMSASELIEMYLKTTMDDVTKMLRLLPLTYEFYSMAFRNEKIRAILNKYFNNYLNMMVPVIQKGIDDGEFRPMDAADAAIAFGATFEGLLLMWMYDPDLVDPERQFESAMGIFMQGLLA